MNDFIAMFDTNLRYIDHKMPQIVDKNVLVKIHADDFAFKKRYTYETIMIDIDTHRVVNLLNSREKDDVTKWLKQYPNISVVSRDGSRTYSSAIADAYLGAIQISDKFHLIKNLSEAVELRSKGMTYKKIAEIIRKKGHSETVDALRVFIQKKREHQKSSETEKQQKTTEYIARKWMAQLIYNKIESIKRITKEQYEEI